MTCDPTPFPRSVLAEASRIAPSRRTTSDGICPGPNEKTGDHYPDARGIPHAVDISIDPGVFDPRDYLAAIVARRDPRVTYIVTNFSGWQGRPNTLPDVIWDQAIPMDLLRMPPNWRQNGTFKRDHAISPHVHVSFTVAAEQSTAPFWIEEDEMTEQDKADIIAGVTKAVVAKLGRQPDGSAGLIGDELVHVLGGYVDGHYVDGALITDRRKERGFSKP